MDLAIFFIYYGKQMLLGTMTPNDDSGKFLVLAQTWFDRTLHPFVRYSLYVTKVTRNYIKFYFLTWNLFHIIFRYFKVYSKQKITFFFLGIPNCELPTFGCFFTPNRPNLRRLREKYLSHNIHRKLIWMIFPRRSFWAHNELSFIIIDF